MVLRSGRGPSERGLEMPMQAGPTEGREREGMWADAGRDRDHAGLPGDVDCRSLGFLPACRAQAQALLLIIRVLDAVFLVCLD